MLWMAVIFMFSAENAEESIETSDSIVDVVVEHIISVSEDELTPTEYASLKESVSHFVRKAAHFTAYMALGILTLSALYQHSLSVPRKRYISLAICVLYAVSDEIHQTFVPGRAGRILDVLIDSAGAAVGILLVSLIVYSAMKKSAKAEPADCKKQ